MPRFKAVLFDVDGTLIDSRPGIFAAFRYAFRQMGLDPADIPLEKYLGPPLRRSFAEHFCEETKQEQAVQLFRQFYAAEGSHMCSVYPGVKAMLQQLQAVGVFTATATSKPTPVVTPILQEQGLAPYLDAINGASMDRSVDTKTAVIRSALAGAEMRGRRCLMVGDREDDMQGARDCGLTAVAVLYGYGSAEELTPWQPQFMAKDCESLLHWILKEHGGTNQI